MTAPPRFDAALTIGAQLDARAAHPDVARRIALVQRDRTWTYGRLRDEAVRTAHFLLGRLRPPCRTTLPLNGVPKEPRKKENRSRWFAPIGAGDEACPIRTPERDTLFVKPRPVTEWSSYSIGAQTLNLGARRRS